MQNITGPIRLLALLVVLGLAATGCGDADAGRSTAASDDASTDSGDDGDHAVAGEDETDHTAQGGSDTADGGSDTADGGSEVPAEADTDDVADGADVAEESDAAAPNTGLFAEAEPDPDRLEDNTFTDHGVRPFVDTRDDNHSTFALDVDTGSYVITRRWLTEGVLPDPASVRVEEFVNAFDYDYPVPESGLTVHVDGGPSPYDDDNVLVRVGVQAAEIDDADRPPAALTFVVDTSGSMDRDDRLGLVKDALTELVDELAGGELVAGGARDIAERQGQLDDLGLADRRGDGRAVGVGDGVGRLGAR